MLVKERDPLLTAARWLVNFIMVAMAITGIIMLVAIPLILFNQDMIVTEIVAEHPAAAGSSLIGPMIVLLLVFVSLFSLAIVWLMNLRRIILTVGEGDPFTLTNADRLSRMGWITLIVQFAAFPATMVAGWLQSVINDMQVDFEFSLTGILLALLLFILARVFRQGAAMREDLEGTV